MRSLLGAAVLVLAVSLATAQTEADDPATPFTAVCKPDEVRGYRDSVTIDGEPLPPEWSENEQYGGDPSWVFQCNGTSLTMNTQPIDVAVTGQAQSATRNFSAVVWSSPGLKPIHPKCKVPLHG